MTKRRVAWAAAALAALGVLTTFASTRLLAQQARQRSLHVSVLDRDDHVVPGLGPADFIVREDKVAREVLRVAPANDPMQIALLVDDSQAATAYVHDYREALAAFITAITDQNGQSASGPYTIALVTLATRPTVAINYTADRAALLKAAERIFAQPDSGTRLLDGIAETSQGFMKRHATRPVVVAITSEGPEVSDSGYIQVLDLLRESGATFQVVGIGTPTTAYPDRARVLDTGARDSGGRYDQILTSRSLAQKLKDLAFDLTHQYLVTYARPDELIPPEHVTVSAARRDLTAHGTLVKDQN